MHKNVAHFEGYEGKPKGGGEDMSNRSRVEGRPGGTESQENEWGPGTWRLLQDEAESLRETHRQVMDSYRSGTIDHLNGQGGTSSGERTPAEDGDRFSEESS